MADFIQQPAEVRRRFARMIADSERQRRADAVRRFERDLPVLGTTFAPLRNLALLDQDLTNGLRGDAGEGAVSRALRLLPEPWCYMNNVVLEHKPQEFMQIDHIAIGPAGVAVIETKRWHGAVLGTADVFRVKSSGRWQRLHSPTTQARWHAQAIARYLAAKGFRAEVFPLVVFVDADWLRAADCCCPVLEGPRALRRHLLERSSPRPLDAQSCREIGVALAAAAALWDLPSPKDSARDAAGAGGAPAAASAPVPAPAAGPATPRQKEYVAELLRSAGLAPAQGAIDRLTRAQAQAVIDRLRFHRAVPLPEGLVQGEGSARP